MIRAYLSLDHLHSFPLAQLSQYLSYFHSLFFIKYFSPVFWREHDMILAIPFCMCYDIVLLLHYDILRLCILFLTGRSVLILHNRSSFVILIGLASFEPRDYRGVFVIQKKRCMDVHRFFVAARLPALLYKTESPKYRSERASKICGNRKTNAKAPSLPAQESKRATLRGIHLKIRKK